MNWKYNKEYKVSVVIIDSGIDEKRNEFSDAQIIQLNNCEDDIGHGTAVASIIHKIAPDAHLFIYKLFNNDGNVNTDILIETLTFLNKFKFDIIHLSCGVVACDNIDGLFAICSSIISNGTTIIAAYDNGGAISYPAAFDNVIGVDWDISCSDGLKYTFINNSPINIMGIGSLQRLPWLNNQYQNVAGSSFAAPYITGLAAKLLNNGIKKGDLLDLLRKNSKCELTIFNNKYEEKNFNIIIDKAIVFPVNKEIHNLLSYKTLLEFNIENVYEPAIFRNVGRTVSEICGYGNSNIIVKSEKQINWNSDFDTVILGHLEKYSSALKRNYAKEFLMKCIQYRKNIFAFDDLSEYSELIEQLRQGGHFCYFPRIDISDVDRKFMNKLYGITTPVLGVFGTSSKQGKFSLQLAIRQIMINRGYKVGGLGTEPSSLLFNIDYVFPMGYAPSIHIGKEDIVRTVNRLMHVIDKKSYDIIIVGGQSQTVPFSTGNIALYPLMQHEFLIGTDPDAVILCVNPFDDTQYIGRTIDYLQGYLDTKVIALSLFPKTNKYNWAVQGLFPYRVDNQILIEKKKILEELFHIPCVIFYNDMDVEELVNYTIDYLSN